MDIFWNHTILLSGFIHQIAYQSPSDVKLGVLLINQRELNIGDLKGARSHNSMDGQNWRRLKQLTCNQALFFSEERESTATREWQSGKARKKNT